MKNIIGFVLFAVLLTGVAGLWYWKTHKKRIIRSQLENALREKTDGLYKVNYTDLQLDELKGSLSVSAFSLKYDSSKFEELKLADKAPFLLFNISIPQIQVLGVKTDRALISKQVVGRHLLLQSPVVEIIYTNAGNDSSRTVPDREVYQQILGKLNLIKLDTVVIMNAEIITKAMTTGRTSVHFFNTSVTMLDVAVDSASSTDTSRLLFSRQVNVDCEKFTWTSRNNLYHYEVDSMSFRSSTSLVRIKDFFVKPQLSEDAFVKRFPRQVDRFDFAVHNIQLKQTDYNLFSQETISADSMLIGSASFKIYRDRNKPPSNESAVGKYPHQMIQQMSIKLNIKKAIVKNTNIEYKEMSPITHQAGRVQLWNSSAYISNITNIKEQIAKNGQMVFDLRSRLLNKVPLSAKWTFYLGNKNGKFALRGHSDGGDATLLNALTVPMGPVEIKKGHINGLDFDLTGTDDRMTGSVKLLYDDLNVALLKKEDDSIHFKRRKVTSLLANLKIKNANPENKKEIRVAEVNYTRNPTTSIFNLAWKSLFTAVQETIGAPRNDENAK